MSAPATARTLWDLWDLPVTYRLGVALASDAGERVPELGDALSTAASAAGCAATITDPTETVSGALAAVRALRAQAVDGVLLLPPHDGDTVVTELVRLGMPTVLMHRLASRTDVDQVGARSRRVPLDEVARKAVGLVMDRIEDPMRPTRTLQLG